MFEIVTDGEKYSFDEGIKEGKFLGFGGNTFYIKLDDGTLLVTNDMWHNGASTKPDNAKFISKEEYECTE